jgi:hypothetical protein
MISEDFVNKYSAQVVGNTTSLGMTPGEKEIRNIDDYLAATVTDIGTSLFNSVIALPKLIGINTDEYRTETYDVLKHVNEDWANYYAESKDVIEASSFLAGSLLPAGLAFKGMKALQAGKMGFYPGMISDASQATRVSELQKLLETGAKATTEFRNTRWKILAANAGQETAQAAGMEIAVLASLNQHAWMEDYLKDPVQNFGISMALGGVIGTGIGQLQARKMLKDKLGPIATEAMDKSVARLIDIPLGISDVDKVQRYSINAKNLRALAEDETENQLTREIARDFATKWEGMAGKLEQNSVFGPGLKAAVDRDAKQQAREIMLSDAAFGANKVDFFTFNPKEFVSGQISSKSAPITEALIKETEKKYKDLWDVSYTMRKAFFQSEAIREFKPEWAKLMQENFKTHYSPYHKAWIPSDLIENYARAVDTGQTTWEKINVKKLNPDAFSEYSVRGVPTANADRYWINTLGTVASTSADPAIYIMASDLGVQNAWLSRLSGLQTEGKQLPKIYLVPDSAASDSVSKMQKYGQLTTLQGLEETLLAGKQNQMKALLQSGASIQEIGIRLNIPTATVERALIEGKSLKDAGNWRLYSNAGAIDQEYLSQTTRTLVFSTNGHRLSSLAFRNADSSAQLDAAKIKQTNRELMANIIASDPGNISKQYYEALNKDDKLWDIFETQLANIVNEKAGSFAFSSADFASREMGDISWIATQSGQKLFGVSNNVSMQLLSGLSQKVRTQISTQTGLNEFNEILNLLASTAGHRDIDIDSGRLYRLLDITTGKPVSADTKTGFIKEPLRHADGREVVLSDTMREFLIEMKGVSRELWHMKNTINKIQGFKELHDIGLWIPSFNPNNKFLSYVIDTEAPVDSSRVKLLIGKSPEELARLEQDWKAKFGNDKRYSLVTKSQQEDYNFWQMRQDPMEMDFADISKFHSGASASAVRVVDDSMAATMIENLHNRVIYYGRKMQEMYLDDIMNTLDTMSAHNQKFFAGQPTSNRAAGLAQREDAARSIKNVLLGNNNLAQHSTWQNINNNFGAMIDWAARKTQDGYRAAFEFDEKTRTLKKSEYVKFAAELEKAGMKNPFKDFNDYILTSQRMEIAGSFQLKSTGGGDMPSWEIKKNGEVLGHMQGFLSEDKKTFFIETISAGKGTIGVTGLKELAHQLKQQYPTIEILEGNRISGVRAKVQREKNGTGWEIANADEAYVAGANMSAPLPQYSGNELAKFGFGKNAEQLRIDALQRKHNIPYESAERIIAAGNSTLAALALRVMEAGHAIVTAMSWPIMAAPEIMRALPKTFLGNALGEGIEVAFPARAIYDGIRFRHSDAAKPLIERWIKEGYGQSIVSEATRLNTLITTGGKGAISEINKIIESPLIKTLSTPSDFAEKESRLWVLSTGYQLARRMYPGISDAGADAFAKEFMTRSIGNYYSAQRPVMFQGTLGVAMGLFQTYMLTWAQSAFRSIENRQFKALAAQMLTQQAMFGTSSLPLYDLFSKTIGEHFSDKHYDLTTGTYRALPDKLAEFVVYGLPASMTIGLYTRGDMQPRIPFTQDSPLDTIAAVNATRQIMGAMGHTLKKVYDANGMTDKFRGLLEGMAMQSISRPVARIVETTPLPDGQGGYKPIGAVSREGNTISTAAEVWSTPGLLSRLVASRSTEEQVKREADYLNSFYGSIDMRNRKEATESLKTAIRGGTLTSEKLEETAGRYLRSGTATGWKAALNEALATSEGGIDYKLGKRLRPDSPLLKMIDENY